MTRANDRSNKGLTRAKILKIDYRTHPDYQFRLKTQDRVNAYIRYFKALVVVLIKHTTHYVLLTPDERASNIFKFSIDVAKRHFNHFRGYDERKVTLRSRAIVDKLKNDGIAVVNLNNVDTESLKNSCMRSIDTLRLKRGYCYGGRKFSESRETLRVDQDKDLYKLFGDAFRSTGILSAISAYLKKECRLVEVTPQINDETDNFWRQDGGGDGQRCSYIHYDAYGDHIKVIVYLNKVEKMEDGPFSYVKRSHIGVSKCMSLLGRIVDESGMSVRDEYSRKLFSSLPGFLQVKCAFGNDLSVDDVSAVEMLKREDVIYGEPLCAIVFDVRGFHRGGMVDRGERMVCTCVVG